MKYSIAAMLIIVPMAASPALVSGQSYPSRPIRIISSEVGGGNDVVSRLIAQGLTGPLGQPVIVENRAPSSFAQVLTNATPDGYTLAFGGSQLWLSELLLKTWPYRVFRDYVPVTMAITSPLLVAVVPSLPVNSVKELIALAKAKPGVLNYGSGVVGAASHLGPELFKSLAGVDIVRVVYKGTGPAYTALASNEVQMMISNAGSMVPYIKSGRVRALAVTSAQPSAMFPSLPTVAADLPGYESVVYAGVFTPAKTPVPIIKKLNQDIVRVINGQETKARLLSLGVEAVGSAPEEATSKIKGEMARMGKVIREVGISAQ